MNYKPVVTFLEKFGLYIGIGLIIFFIWQGFFGANGALNLIKEGNRDTQAQMELLGKQMELLNQQTQIAEAVIQDLKKQQEAARQHIGTVARKEYHPAMKRVKKQNAQEQIEEVHRYNLLLGLSNG